MNLTQVEGPTSYPVTLQEVKANGRITHTDEDALISSYIAAATDAVELATGKAWAAQTWRATLDAFEDEIVIPMGPVTAVVEITYLDSDGVSQTVADTDYTVDTESADCRIAPVTDWPTAQDIYNAVTIEFTVGPAAAKPQIKQAITLLAQHWYENRAVLADKNEMPLGVQFLIGLNRRMWV